MPIGSTSAFLLCGIFLQAKTDCDLIISSNYFPSLIIAATFIFFSLVYVNDGSMNVRLLISSWSIQCF